MIRNLDRDVLKRLKIDVPKGFIVPDSPPWPESLRNTSFGKRFEKIINGEKYSEPKFIAELKKLGIQVSKFTTRERRFALIYQALVTYKSIYG